MYYKMPLNNNNNNDPNRAGLITVVRDNYTFEYMIDKDKYWLQCLLLEVLQASQGKNRCFMSENLVLHRHANSVAVCSVVAVR